MQLKINHEEAEFLSFMIEERRAQLKAVLPLWDRHHRQDAKHILDGFPYDKGELIPYLKRNKDGGTLLWEASTHNDLIADLRDHLAEQQKAEKKTNRSIVIVHELLKKIEAMTEKAKTDMKKD